MPIMRAIPTGSFAPASPSRIVPERPPTSRLLPSTENMTAGSVGASAAPMMPEIVQLKPSAKWAKTAIRPAVAKVPRTPRTVIGHAEARKRRQPICMPPSKRMTTMATTPIRSTVRMETCSPIPEKTSETIAAATRKIPGAGIGTRSVSFVESSASVSPAATMRTISPNWPISVTAVPGRSVPWS